MILQGDVPSVALCQRLVVQLNGKMLEFSFRNGHLRRKFDSLKYSLRAIENALCELSFVEPLQEIVREQTRPKRQRVEQAPSAEGTTTSGDPTDTVVSENQGLEEEQVESLFDADGFDAIRSRLDAVDAIREDAIKLSRDAQKWSKQAIFAVQRGAYADASAKLKIAESVLLKIQTLIEPVRLFIY